MTAANTDHDLHTKTPLSPFGHRRLEKPPGVQSSAQRHAQVNLAEFRSVIFRSQCQGVPFDPFLYLPTNVLH